MTVGTNTLILSSDQEGTDVENNIYTESGDLFIQSNADNSNNVILNYSNDGKVGVGTDNPLGKFQVGNGMSKVVISDHFVIPNTYWNASYIGFNAARNEGTSLWNLGTNGYDNGGSIILNDVGGNIRFISIKSNQTSGAPERNLTDETILNNTKFVINKEGKVGIGTPNPVKTLHIRDFTPSDEVVVDNQLGDIGGSLRLENEVEFQGSTIWDIEPIYNADATLKRLQFTNQGIAVLSLNESGKVGIGTSEPLGKLQVGKGLSKILLSNSFSIADETGTYWNASYLGFNAGRKSDGNWQFDTDGYSNGGSLILNSSGGSMRFITVPNSTAGTQQIISEADILDKTKMTINNNGVGVGTDDPIGKLHVKGGYNAVVIESNTEEYSDISFRNTFGVTASEKIWTLRTHSNATNDLLDNSLELFSEKGGPVIIKNSQTNFADLWTVNNEFSYGFGIDDDNKFHIYSDLNPANRKELMTFYQGKVKIDDLADDATDETDATTRMVVAGADGTLTTQPLSINTADDGSVGIGSTGETTTINGSSIELGDPANTNNNVNVNGSIILPISGNSSTTTIGITLDGFASSNFGYNTLFLKRYGFGFHLPTQSSTSSNGSFISGYGGIDFFTSDNNRLSIKQNGKVGIGTDDPKEKFQIGEIFTFHDSGTKMIGRNVYFSGTDKKIKAESSSAIKFNSNGSLWFTVDNSAGTADNTINWKTPLKLTETGNVEIGDANTTDYPSTLTVNSSLNFKILPDKNSDATALMLVKGSDGIIGTKEVSSLCSNITCDEENSEVGLNSGYKKISFGKAPPNAIFTGSNYTLYGSSYIGFNATRETSGNWNIKSDGASNGAAVITSSIHGDISFFSIPKDGSSDRNITETKLLENLKMNIRSNGVIIGSSTLYPQAILHIKDAGDENGNVLPIVENTGTGAAGWKFLTGGGINGPYWIIHAAGVSNQGLGKFVFRSDSVEVMTLTQETVDSWNKISRVGIGTTNPLVNLQVNGLTEGKLRVGRISNYIDMGDDGTNNFISSIGRLYINKTNQKSVEIGSPVTDQHANLYVNGNIWAYEIKVKGSNPYTADFVFNKDYKLPSLCEVENYITENKHLKDVPSAKEIEAEGTDLQKMTGILLQKIEELTLYTIQQQKQIDELNKKLNSK